MYVIRIEHPVPNFEGWKRAFDSDPVDRKGSGVRRYRVFRDAENPDHVGVDLDFDTLEEAQAMLAALTTLWGQVEGTVMSNARARILSQVEETEL